MAEGDELSGITVIYLIAVGLQVFVLLFIFAKRQIMRFGWASRREPHTEVGKGAPKWFKTIISENIEKVQGISGEPRFIKDSKAEEENSQTCRMHAMVEIQDLDKDLDHANCKFRRRSKEDFYLFLKKLRERAIPEMREDTLVRIAVLYEWARFSSKPFNHTELQEFRQLLDQLKALIRRNREELANLTSEDFKTVATDPNDFDDGKGSILNYDHTET